MPCLKPSISNFPSFSGLADAESVALNAVTKAFDNTPRESLIQKISDVVLQTKDKIDPVILNRYIDKDARDAYIKTTLVELMSTPEYQLC